MAHTARTEEESNHLFSPHLRPSILPASIIGISKRQQRILEIAGSNSP
jgi:hypothetical protein